MELKVYHVPMRDGIKLYTVVITPEETGKFPMVLIRNPYFFPSKEDPTAESMTKAFDARQIVGLDPEEFHSFLDNGYGVILQHTRGTGNSEGEHIHSLTECDDACDTLDWIRQQDFYNEEIFRFGTSYVGMTSLIDAKAHHKDVKGIAVMEPVLWFYLSQVNGVYNTGWRGGWTAMMSAMGGKPIRTSDINMYRTFPQKDWGDLILGHPDYIYDINFAHPFEDDPFYRTEAPGYEIFESLETLETPTLFLAGWFDLLINPNLRTWNTMMPKETREKSAMVILPFCHGTPALLKDEGWAHFSMDGSNLYTFSANWAVNWFNHIRNGEPLHNVRKGEIAFFPEAGQNKWYYEKGSFTNAKDVVTLYLNQGRKLESEKKESFEETYLYNPYNPVWFWNAAERSGGIARPGGTGGVNNLMQDQDPPNFRYDVISFTGHTFDKHCFIKGEMNAKLTVKSDCEDTCFYIRVCLKKNGITYCIRDDIRTLCHELGDYTPGTEVELNFKTSPICWEVQPGDELRIDVTSSAYPIFAPHTNVKAPIQAEVERPVYAHNTVVCGKSSITVPVTEELDYPYISLTNKK